MDPISALSKFGDRAQKVAERAGMYKGPLWGIIVCLLAAGLSAMVGPMWLVIVEASLAIGFFGLCVASFVYATRHDKPELLLSESTHQTIEMQRMLMGQKGKELNSAYAPKPIAADSRLREMLEAEPMILHEPHHTYIDSECAPFVARSERAKMTSSKDEPG